MFEETTYSGSEGGPPVLICAEITALNGTIDCDLVVTFSDIPSTKTGMSIFFVLINISIYTIRVYHMNTASTSSTSTRVPPHS